MPRVLAPCPLLVCGQLKEEPHISQDCNHTCLARTRGTNPCGDSQISILVLGYLAGMPFSIKKEVGYAHVFV